MIKKFKDLNENIVDSLKDWDDEDFDDDETYIEDFKPVLTKSEPMHYVSTADIIAFIEKNSDMGWNMVCKYVYKEGILHHDGPDFYSSREFDDKRNFNELTNKWIGGFFKVHPWIKRMMVVFDN